MASNNVIPARAGTQDRAEALDPRLRGDERNGALRFITCGSVDDGKSTLIGRLLVDSRAVLQDQLASVSRAGAADRLLGHSFAQRRVGWTSTASIRLGT